MSYLIGNKYFDNGENLENHGAEEIGVVLPPQLGTNPSTSYQWLQMYRCKWSWINFNPSIDKLSYARWNLRWNELYELSNPKLQRLHSLGIDEQF